MPDTPSDTLADRIAVGTPEYRANMERLEHLCKDVMLGIVTGTLGEYTMEQYRAALRRAYRDEGL